MPVSIKAVAGPEGEFGPGGEALRERGREREGDARGKKGKAGEEIERKEGNFKK